MQQAQSFKAIRSWRGSQDQAFEELCFQLRSPTPNGAELIKTGAPDGGLEWYFKLSNGTEWGWQAKYTFDIDVLLKLMEASLKTIVKKRPRCRRLTFCIPFDLSDQPEQGKRKGARQKFADRQKSWRERIPGASRVRIDLWSEGALLEKLSGHPNQRGITWFFWSEDIFTPDWCKKRLDVTLQAAGDRYTPELHVDLPVAFSLEGLSNSDLYRSRYRRYRARLLKLAERLEPRRRTGLGVTPQLRDLARALQAWREVAVEMVRSPDRMSRQSLLDVTNGGLDAVSASYPDVPDSKKKLTEKQQRLRDQKLSLQYDLQLLEGALSELASFLESPASAAAEYGTLLLTGDAGQGKTHLFCDTGKRAIEAGQPAVVLLGGQFPGRNVWSSIAAQFGVGDIGSEALVGGMQAAAEASGSPFLLFVDALNEAAEPQAWQEELPALLAQLSSNPWIDVGLSVRSSFLQVVMPDEDRLPKLARVDHPGFRGRELEATERFFDHFGIQQPRVPLLTPEFTNPLFLKLYCEGLKGLGLTAPPDGESHISDVFARYLEWKEQRIVSKLKLDPQTKPVSKALDAFSQAMATEGKDQLPYESAADLLNQFAPGKTDWPDTMLGQLLNESILASEMAWDIETGDYHQVVRFTYQRFGDYRAVSAMLASIVSKEELGTSLAAGQPLREAFLKAPAGWIEALSVLLPERLGVELLDAANWRLRGYRREIWDRALVTSIATRKPEAITGRSRELVKRAQGRSRGLGEEVLDALLTVAPHPTHPLNAEYLHKRLMGFSLPHRDMAWSKATYFSFGDGGPLDRLIRWAARSSSSETPVEIVELAAIPIVWTFTSPNRRMRDYATKALVSLFSSRLGLLSVLLQRFQGVNDPYVAERLAAVAHGAVLAGGANDHDGAMKVAEVLKDVFLEDEQIPNLLTRDAIRGAWEWCLREGLIDSAAYAAIKPPYGSEPPSEPRGKEALEDLYERNLRDDDGNYIGSPYSSLFMSLFDLGDFGRYVVQSKIEHFSTDRLDEPSSVQDAEISEEEKWKEFEESLSFEQRARWASADPASVAEIVEGLGDAQRDLLFGIVQPTSQRRGRPEYSSGQAVCWIFERVLSLGWTPERFNEWERIYTRERGDRTGHKLERFGKKYQWIALRELLARMADNFHMVERYAEESGIYEGPWQISTRDIDPALPPADRIRDSDDGMVFADTFPSDEIDSWWVPPGPRFKFDDPAVPDDWASDTADLPPFQSLVRKQAPDKSRWIALQAYYNWDEERDDEGDIQAPRRRDIWSHIKGWLVDSGDAGGLIDFLGTKSLMGNWMPEGREVIDAGYIAELPWAEATQQYPAKWAPVEPRRSEAAPGFEVYPTWMTYLWEGSVWDCSIDNSVRAVLPAPLLTELGGLRWEPGTQNWVDHKGSVVAQYREAKEERHSLVLVRESWLRKLLKANGWHLVVGWLGEKTLFSRDWISPRIIGGSWTEINGLASFDGETWSFIGPRFEQRTSRGD